MNHTALSTTDLPDSAPEHRARRRRKVLLSAYTLSPARGSEPAGGWNVCVRMARYHDVHVLCSPLVEGEDYRTEIEQAMADRQVSAAGGGAGRLTIHYVEPPLLSRVLQRPGGTLARLLYYVGYRSWQQRAVVRARELMQAHQFDLVHQLNMTGFREPGYLWRLGVPFVWGPVGGACRMPWSYFRLLSWKDRLLYGVRNAGTAVQARFSPRVGRAARSARWLWHISDPERVMLRRHLDGCGSAEGAHVEQMLDSGASEQALARVRRCEGRGPLRLVWSGVHIGRKALPILLHALADLERADERPADRPGWILDVLGEGPLTPAWQAAARRLGVADRVNWRGRLPHGEAMRCMADAHALVFTSLLEGSPHVVVEALSLGLPVICHDACGMGIAVTEQCGIKVPLRTLGDSVAGFAGGIRSLLDDPSQVERFSKGALDRSRTLSWDRKVEQMARAYEQVLTEGARLGGEEAAVSSHAAPA
jgi:glycosyltransferase involved in cell wall biosynthesis